MAIYSRVLSGAEVSPNRDAGRPVLQTAQPTAVSTDLFKRFVILGSYNWNTPLRMEAYGAQYPDQRCVVCTSNGTNSMTIYADINNVVASYQAQDVTVRWLD